MSNLVFENIEQLWNIKIFCPVFNNNWFLYYDDMTVDDEGWIEFSDYYRKWYEEEKFHDFIKGFVEQGNYIEGQGEEYGDIWRVEFDGKSNFKTQNAKWVINMNKVSSYRCIYNCLFCSHPCKETREFEKEFENFDVGINKLRKQ